MVKYYILLAASFVIELIFCPLFLHFQRPGKNNKSRTCKMICATMYIAQCLLCMQISGIKSYFGMFMLLGFTASWFGDLFIHINDKPLFFIIGAVGFFTAHILYTTAYIKTQQTLAPDTPFITMLELKFVFGILLLLFAVILKSGMEMKPPVLVGVFVYGTMIVTMCVKAVSLSLRCYNSKSAPVWFAVALTGGAILFLLSDFSIVFCSFDKRYKKNVPLKNFNIWTYFIGQTLLASSILFF